MQRCSYHHHPLTAAHPPMPPTAAVLLNRCPLAWPWRALMVLVAGGLASMVFQPTSWWWLLWPCCTLLLAQLLHETRLWRGFLFGWLFGFGLLVPSLYWISNAFLVDADRFAWAIPVVATALPAGLALFTGFAGLAVVMLPVGKPVARWLMLAVAWVVGEWLRGWVLTGFPWNLLGYAWSERLVPLQLVSLTGIFGLTLISLLVASAPALLLDSTLPVRLRRRVAAAVALLLLLWLGYGVVRLHQHPIALDPNFRVRIVQPAIAQAEKWTAEGMRTAMQRLITLSNQGSEGNQDAAGDINLLLWPETVVQQDLSTALGLRDYLVRAVSPALASDGHLMTGMVRMNSFLAQANDSELDPASLQLHNSMAAIDRHGVLVDSYDKVKLVPLGEYVPYRHYLKHLDLSRLTPGPYDFLPGQNDHLIRLSDGSKWVPLICYEVIFPNLRLRPYFGGDQPPRAMTAITNDAWFGNSKGPYQHLAMARVRAVEYGLPLLRAANTGISAISDPMGRTLARLPLGQLGHLDGDLPLTVPSFYAQQGERPIGAILLLLLLLIARICRPKTAT